MEITKYKKSYETIENKFQQNYEKIHQNNKISDDGKIKYNISGNIFQISKIEELFSSDEDDSQFHPSINCD